MKLLGRARHWRGAPWAALGALCALPVALRSLASPGAIAPEAETAPASSTRAEGPLLASSAAAAQVLRGAPGATEKPTAAPPVLYAVSTPLSERELAQHIAAAWQAVMGQPIQRRTLAVLWAHAALETGRGKKMLGYNFAGLKGHAPNGGGRQLWTWEESSEGLQRVRRTFRVYPSAEEGAYDYVLLLATRHRRAVRAAERGSPIDFVAALADSDYFTHDSGQYGRSVASLTLEYLKENPEPASAGGL